MLPPSLCLTSFASFPYLYPHRMVDRPRHLISPPHVLGFDTLNRLFLANVNYSKSATFFAPPGTNCMYNINVFLHQQHHVSEYRKRDIGSENKIHWTTNRWVSIQCWLVAQQRGLRKELSAPTCRNTSRRHPVVAIWELGERKWCPSTRSPAAQQAWTSLQQRGLVCRPEV